MVSLRFRDGNILQKKDTIRLGLDGSYRVSSLLHSLGGSLLPTAPDVLTSVGRRSGRSVLIFIVLASCFYSTDGGLTW